MARPSTYESRKEALIQAAFDLFIEQGYENTTLTQIMMVFGTTKAGMYHYFTSKEEILEYVIDYGMKQCIDMFKKSMEGLNVKEKMILFTKGNTNPNNMTLKLLQLKSKDKDSYSAYRIRERFIHAYIPVMEEIIKEGVAQGVYTTTYPKQAAEIMILLVKGIFEDNILPTTSHEEKILRVKAFLQIVELWLRPSPDHYKDISDLFEEELSRIVERNEANETE